MVITDQDVLVNAILAGTPAERIKATMEQLETRQKQLQSDLALAPAPFNLTRIHPKMADTYHACIRALIAGLTERDQDSEAREAIRQLIGKIVATPISSGGKRCTVDLTLHGELAGILALSLGGDLLPRQQKTSCEQEVMESVEFWLRGHATAVTYLNCDAKSERRHTGYEIITMQFELLMNFIHLQAKILISPIFHSFSDGPWPIFDVSGRSQTV